MLIKLNNKSYLREHPFLDPLNVPLPVQAHSYIFPGDELLLYHKISLPADTPATNINDIKLVGANVSVIAQKPNVFSEEFSNEFASTRVFELDSFTTPFNNSNARIIPWGLDGYAPNLTVKQDREFLLPSGDLRREVNFFTTHTNGTANWDYWFYFPILFRWEYWLALQKVDNDFYTANAAEQNGFNNWWFHYYVLNKWKIKSRLDVDVLINGVANRIRAELELPSINDYATNTDYTNKEIKTGRVGAVLSNTPSFIYGNEYTVVVGSLRKVTPFITDEKDSLSAVSWVEPFEGAGVTMRTRGSSKYKITPESAFVGLGFSPTDDDGIGLQNNTGQYVVFNSNGTGALILFGATPEQITIVSILDNNKLNTIYSGTKAYSLYNRLYNSKEEFEDAEPATLRTRKGEEIKQQSTFVTLGTNNTICKQRKPDCPFILNVYAHATDTDELKNDKSGFYYYGNGTIETATLTLQKNDSSCGDGGYIDQVTINSNALGKFFPFGKNPDFTGVDFTDDYGKKYTGVLLEWRKVLQQYGEGKYRVKISRTDYFGNTQIEYDQREYCLSTYTCNRTKGTVRIEITNQGLAGKIFETELTDYAGGWYDQYRLKGVFKFISSENVKEYTQYDDSMANALKPYINEQSPKFRLSIRPIPGWLDFVMSTDVLQADEILITDYNPTNRHKLVKVPVINEGAYTPRDNKLANALSDVSIDFSYGRNNLRKTNSQ